VDINRSNYQDIRKNSHYYIIGHLSAVVKPGATRIGAGENNATGLVYSAFENTDGTYALVLMNSTADNKKITVSDGAKSFTHTVPSKSVVSYKW
jgi:glucosylceramidase